MLALGIVVMAGCGDARGAGEIVYDTIGGVPAILNPERGLLGDSIPWTLHEHLRVSQDQLYDRVAATFPLDVGILPDRGFAVLDAGNQRVLRFRADGSYDGAFGKQGEEPGQFRNPFMLEVADTLVYVLDIGLNRVSAFGIGGGMVSSFGIELAGLAGTTPLFEVGAPGEIYLAAEPLPFGMQQVRDTGRAVIYRMNDEGAITDTVLTYRPADWTPLRLLDGRTTLAKPRFWPEPRLDARGSYVAASYIAPYVIDVRRPDGRTVRRIARRYENAPVVASVRDSVLARLASGPNRMSREVLELIPFEAEIPALEGLVLDDEGRIWADPYVPDEPTRRDLFDAEGRFLGPVYLPEPVQLKDVRGDRACGVISGRDSRSAEVVCYRIEVPPAAI